MSNLNKLTEAGIVKPGEVNDHEKSLIDSLSSEEVTALISIKSKAEKSNVTPKMEVFKFI